MNFVSPSATVKPSAGRNAQQAQDVLLRVLSVDPANHSLQASVVPTAGCTLPEQTLTVKMDLTSMNTPQRQQAADKAKGAWCGALIDEKTDRHCRRQPMIVAQSARIDANRPDLLKARWLMAMGDESRIVHGLATVITSLYADQQGDPQHAKARWVRVWSPQLLDAANPRAYQLIQQRLATGARNAALPRDTFDPQTNKLVIGSALRRYSVCLFALAPASNEVLERTPVFTTFSPAVYPDYVPTELRTRDVQGERQPRPIPIDEQFFDDTYHAFGGYLTQRYGMGQFRIAVALACDFRPSVDSPMCSSKPYDANNRDRYSQIHRDNLNGYRTAPNDAAHVETRLGLCSIIMSLSPCLQSISDYVNSACLSFPLGGSVFEHLTFERQPLIIPDAMRFPLPSQWTPQAPAAGGSM
tara:strand:- start:3469 stop:4707 length:1239 start_codon:yes stop_codon:yes gene_type:complete